MNSGVDNQTMKTENYQKNAYSMFAYYDNIVVGYNDVGCVVICRLY